MKQQLNRLKCAVLAALTMGLALGAEADNVAEVTIGGMTTQYSDIGSAWSACNGKDATLKLLANVDITSALNKSWTTDLLLDLGGHTLKQTGTDRIITVHYKMTVSNGVLTRSDGEYGGDGAGIYVYHNNDEQDLTQLVMRGITMTNCVATSNGGAIYAERDTQVLLENCTLRQNSADGSGGAIYTLGGQTENQESKDAVKDPWDKLVLISTLITDNTACTSGAGVYYKCTVKGDSCFVAGTKVLMADGSEKVIEAVEEGDVVRTFDHEGGTNSAAEVFLTVKEPITTQIFVLSFADGYAVRCVLSHDFLMKDGDTCKYVCLSRENAADYVGKSFYAADGKWHELLSVTDGETVNEVYEIYTAKHLNSYADGLLTVPADVAHVLNIYKLGENLKADAEQLAADVAAYGLAEFSEMSTKYGMSRAYYDAFGVKYGYVIIGKGLMTLTQQESLYRSTGRAASPLAAAAVDGGRGATALPKLMSLPKLTGAEPDPLADYATSRLTLGAGTIVTNNLVGSKPNNIYLEKAGDFYSLIALANDRAGICAGVTLQWTTGQITAFYNANPCDVALFSSDNADYAVWYALGDDETYLKLAESSQIVPPTIANTSYEIWEGDEIIAWNEGTTVEKYSNVKVVYTADDGYVFKGGATTKEVTVDTSKSIATMTPPDEPILLIEYTAPVYRGSDGNPTNGIERWETKSVYNYTVVESSASAVTWGESGATNWYVVTGGDFQIDGGVTCQGHVNLILCEGAKLAVTNLLSNKAGIATDPDGSFTIYGQPEGAGALEVFVSGAVAAIGGGLNEPGRNITINGGQIMVLGHGGGTGIGGGRYADGSNITINGGTVYALGSDGAGIGGGPEGGAGSYITINGGEVTATNLVEGCAIGGGYNGPGYAITINGGRVTAVSPLDSTSAAGIGGSSAGSGYDIRINGGEVTACGSCIASAIGGGCAGAGSNIVITAGRVAVQAPPMTFMGTVYASELIGSGATGGASQNNSVSAEAEVFFNLTGVLAIELEEVVDVYPMPEDFDGFTIMTPEVSIERTLVGGYAVGGGTPTLPAFALTNAVTGATGTIAVNGGWEAFASTNLKLKHADNALTLLSRPGVQVGDDVFATIDSGLCTVVGTGDMWSYDKAGASTLWDSRESITNLVVSDGVTSVGSRFFENMWWLRDVSLGASVTNVGERAFKKCYGLTNVTSVASGALAIGDYVFSGCHSLQAMTFADTPTFGTESYSLQAAIYMDGDIPIIYPIPQLKVGEQATALRIKGKQKLGDSDWTDVTEMADAERKTYHFFKVVMP